MTIQSEATWNNSVIKLTDLKVIVLMMLCKESLHKEDSIILGGDLNCPLNLFLNKKGVH